jgi:hypothetical protein
MPDTPHGRKLSPGEEAQAKVLTTPQRLPQLPITPQPVLREPAPARGGISRRAILFGGLMTAGIVVAGGTALLALHKYPATGGQTSGSTPTKPIATPTAAVPAPLAQDTFHRSDQQFWGTASDGQTWEQNAATSPEFSIAGQTGKIYRVGQGSLLYTAILGPIITDADVVVSGSISQFNSSHLGVLLRWTDDTHYYKAYIDGKVLYLLRRPGPGASPVLASVPFSAQANTSYTLRFRAIGATLQAKVWPTGSTEPVGWMVSAHDTLFTSGRAGLRPQVSQEVTLQVTSFTLNMATGS